MKREIRIFFTSLMFYTRIPCPRWVDHSEEYINLATRYFALIGWLVGGAAALVYYGSQFVFDPAVSLLLSIIASVLITGAFHEDGFADVCDGFGGGWTKEKILTIMKDSRVGAYGVIGLLLLFALKFLTLLSLANQLPLHQYLLLFVVAHSLSRLSSVFIIRTSVYAREDGDSKGKPIAKSMSTATFIIALGLGIIPLVAFLNYQIWFSLLIVPLLLIPFYLRRYFTKWIGGYTGDCLGANQQVTEVFLYLTSLVVWKFI